MALEDELQQLLGDEVKDANASHFAILTGIFERITLLKGDVGEPAEPPTDEKLLEIIKPLIPIVEDGHTPTDQELLALINPLIPKPIPGIDGENAETPTDTELLALIKPLIPDPIPGKDISPELEEELREEIDELKDEIIKTKKQMSNIPRGAGPNANAVLVHDASPQCNGVNKTFTMPMARIVRAVHCTQFPFFYRPTVDFTIGDRSITLTGEVAAPEAGQSFFIDYVK